MQGSRDWLGVQTAFYMGPKNSWKPVWEVAFLLGLNEPSQNKKMPSLSSFSFLLFAPSLEHFPSSLQQHKVRFSW